MLRNSKNSKSSRSFQSRTFKNNRVISSDISIILNPERSFYDDLFKRYKETNSINKINFIYV